MDVSEQVRGSDQAKEEYGALKADASTTHQTDDDIHQTDDAIHQTDAETHQTNADIHQTDAETHQKDDDIHQTDAETHQTNADIHQTDVETHQTNADYDTHLIDLTRQTDADTRQMNVDSRQKSPDTVTPVTAESKGNSGNTVQSGLVVGSLGKKRKLPGWLSRGSMAGEKEDTQSSKDKKTKGDQCIGCSFVY